MNTTLTALALIFGAVVTAQATPFYSISAVETSAVDFFSKENLIQGPGSGFSASEPHNAAGTIGRSYLWATDDPGGYPSDYIAVAGPPVIWLDLGADTNLGEISVWGYSSSNANGPSQFSLRFATEAEGADAGVLGDESYGTSVTYNPTFGDAPDGVSPVLVDPRPRQSFSFSENVTARYVEVTIDDTWFTPPGNGPLPGGDRAGVGEVAFAVQPTPGVADIDVAPAVALDLFGFPTFYNIPVTNVGQLDLTLTSITFSGANAGAFLLDFNPSPIGSLQTDFVSVEFDPDGLGGAISATMIIASNDLDESPIEVLLTGTLPELEQDILVSSPAELALGNFVESFFIEVDNVGGADLVITGTNLVGANADAFLVTFAPESIPGGFFDLITLQFDPAGLSTGPIEATLQIMSNDPDTSTAEVVLVGGLPAEFYTLNSVQTNTVNFYSPFNLIAGIGAGFETSWPHTVLGGGPAATWVTNDPNGEANSYYDNAQPVPVIIFDLGQDQSLSEISTWGYSNGNTNGGKDFSLRFATEVEGTGGFGSSIAYNPSFEAAFSATTRDSHLFSETVTARYVEMTVINNWRGLQPGRGGGDRVGFGEVAFEVLPAIPNLAFDVVDVDVLAGGNVQLTFESIENTIYELERSIDGETFTKLTDTAVGGAGATSLITDTDPLSGEAVVLYRVIDTGTQAP